jgi:hypothetical protein
MAYSGKVVLHSTSGYRPEHDDGFLRELYQDGIELFCVLGRDAAQWEDALDWICIGEDGTGQHLIITTCHRNASLEEVVEFAKIFRTDHEHVVQVIER